MNGEYVLLVEKEEIWARMLMQILEDNCVPHTAVPVYGTGFAMKTGIQERLKVYVPSEKLLQATELLEELFSSETVDGEE